MEEGGERGGGGVEERKEGRLEGEGGGRGGGEAKEIENKERGTFFRPLMLCLHNNFNTERLPIQKCCLHVACQRKNDKSCRTASLCLLDTVFLHLKSSDG